MIVGRRPTPVGRKRRGMRRADVDLDGEAGDRPDVLDLGVPQHVVREIVGHSDIESP
jgi:hypothetical protein